MAVWAVSQALCTLIFAGAVAATTESTVWLRDINISTRTGLTVDISLSRKEFEPPQEEIFTITTPSNEILELEQADVPGLIVHSSSDFVASRVTIGPMEASLLGSWTLCGEVNEGNPKRRCQTFIIRWNNNNNQSEEWQTRTLNTRDSVTNYLAIIDTSISGSGHLLTCHLITPDGEDLVLTADTAFPGLTFMPHRDTTICRINMGPIHKEFLGDWTLYALFYSSRFGTTEARLPLDVYLYNEENPYSQAYNVTILNPLTQIVNLGSSSTLESVSSGTTDSCELRSPTGQIFDLQNSTEPVTFLAPNSRVRCRVSIGPISLETLGNWTFIAKFNNRGIFTENRQIISLTLKEEEWLTDININTRIGLIHDISLSKKELDSLHEKFTIITPENEIVPLEKVNIPGVKVHGRSEFVDSRVTIGPMDPSLIGSWTLCGEVNVGKSVRRCQPVTFSWNNLDNPSEVWSTTALTKRDIVTNYLATFTTNVRGSGTLRTCHLITPNGEDLVLTTDSAFPGLALVVGRDTSICTISMRPVYKQFIGDWTFYATFRSSRGETNEVRLPLNLSLYDEENPYSQAYNVTTLEPLIRVINLGTNINSGLAGSGTTDSCELRSPSGKIFNLANSTEPVSFLAPDSRVRCRVTIGPIDLESVGDWKFIAKFNNRGEFTEHRQTIQIILEDPKNPIIEDHRTILLGDMIYFNTALGAEHTIEADPNISSRFVTESCHVRTPNGRQYTIMDGFDLPGVEVIANTANRCIIKVNVESKEFIGEWTLISREQRNSEAVEVRQPFIILVEVRVNASSGRVTVSEGNDLYLHLAQPTNLIDTCKLYDPSGSERTDREIDTNQVDTCGFIVRNVQYDDSGVWHIRFGTGITYRANVKVVVKDQWETSHDAVVLTRGRSVNKTLGPESTVYCKLTDPSQRVIFEGYGRCNLALSRVTSEHAGTWTMNVGFRGNLLTRTYKFTVVARGSEDKPIVSTSVFKKQPEVILKCSVPVEYEVNSCHFQKPSRQMIIVSEGVGENRFISHGSGTTMNGNVTTHECGLRITNPATADLGIWRCTVQTERENYYGFLWVLCPWAMQDPATAAAVVSEPTLTAREEDIAHIEGDSLTLTCSIQSPIRYCYFRRPNGLIYSVTPGISSDEFEYIGAGLDAGECGIRFSRLLSQDEGRWPEGRWSCHAGLLDPTKPEQRADIQISINRPIEVNQYVSERGLIVEADVFQQQNLEYCRYVRIDGLGFTSEALPDPRYLSFENLRRGHCGIRIENSTILEMHPWTIAAKIMSRDDEVLGVTSHTMEIPTLAPENNYTWWLYTIIFSGFLMICVGIILIRAINRWSIIARTTSWRDSIRRSLKKTPLPDEDASRAAPLSA